jgi:hypothetical protein
MLASFERLPLPEIPAETLAAWEVHAAGPAASDDRGQVATALGEARHRIEAIRFGLPAQMPEACEVQSATLRLYAGSSASGRTLQALQVNAAWTEMGVTWGTQPTTTGTAATTTSASGYRQWNVTAQVQAMFDAGANHGFLIRDANENQDHEQQFHSREKAPDNPPQLVVTYGPG